MSPSTALFIDLNELSDFLAALGYASSIVDSAYEIVEQLNAFAKLYRHPEARIIDIAFYGLVNIEKHKFGENKNFSGMINTLVCWSFQNQQKASY